MVCGALGSHGLCAAKPAAVGFAQERGFVTIPHHPMEVTTARDCLSSTKNATLLQAVEVSIKELEKKTNKKCIVKPASHI